MKIGYARISTKEQNFDLQIDALKKSGCKKLHKEIISGARPERQVLNELFAVSVGPLNTIKARLSLTKILSN